MHKKIKSRQRSVAIQSSNPSDPEIKIGVLAGRLCKKKGFRNLLQKSVIVVSRENEPRSENIYSPGRKMSRSVQAALDGDYALQRLSADDYHASELSTSKPSVSETVRIHERGTTSFDPGTSRPSAAFSSFSILSQMNELYEKPQEGSLAVHNYCDKAVPSSRSSNLFYYGSQGSRRFSDETVLLIEDYQSYDYLNAAGRQERRGSSHGRRTFSCCRRSKRSSANVLIRPLPISFEDIIENDEVMVCRICHEGENVDLLIQPCLCKGSVGCVHAKCLKIWLEQSNTSRCELCNYPYAIMQTKKYTKCVSVRVFVRTVVDKRALAYDVVSFVVITPLTLVGIAMCIQASIYSTVGDPADSNFQMGNITRAGMIMLSGTILVAYGVWLYTLISYHVKAWRKWYSNCFDVEVLPIRMTSEERLEAARRLDEEINRRQASREYGSTVVTVLNSPNPESYSFYQRRVPISETNR